MKHHKPKAHPVWGGGDFIPHSVNARDDALPGGIQQILDLIDTADPAWPSIAAVLREFTAAGIEITEDTAAMAVKLGKGKWAAGCPTDARRGVIPADVRADAQATLAAGSPSIVYYIRRGPVIKIGTTANPVKRFADLMPDEILAVEPGGSAQEAFRHRQFSHLRGSGEHFRDAQELRDHIAAIRAAYGEPDLSWPTTATLTQRPERWRLTVPSSTETLTAMEAEAELGVKEGLIRSWVHRGRIQVAGRDERGRHIFYREHLILLRDSTRKRLVTRL